MAKYYSEELIELMTAMGLLACVTPSAIQYIRKTVDTKNASDYRKLKKLFDEQWFEANSFDDSQLNVLSFDWQSLERDRNWWWQLQALPFLNWYTNSVGLQSSAERSRYFSMCLLAIQNWISKAKANKASPLAWHDHAGAFRVRNLTNWLIFAWAERLPIEKQTEAKVLDGLIYEHLGWLQEDRNYSKHTNHGFDQAMIALTIASMFSSAEFAEYRHRNRERLKDEVSFAFTDEGVHKENSPGYHKVMLGRLRQLGALAVLGEHEISQMGECYIAQAGEFLRAITLPNGYLPMIGDTRGGDKGLSYEQKDSVDVLDYSASGYVVVRGKDGLDKEFFILLKNTHESNYHRHDDDMMIYIFYDGEVVLGDGGLYKYQEKDEVRIQLRSYLSHSVPFIDAKVVRNNKHLTKKPVFFRDRNGAFVMTSYMFGEPLTRSVLISFSEGLKVEIRDLMFGDTCKKLWQNFFFEKDVGFTWRQACFEMDFPGFIFSIDAGVDVSPSLKKKEICVDNRAVVSRLYGEVEKASRFSFQSNHSFLNFKSKF